MKGGVRDDDPCNVVRRSISMQIDIITNLAGATLKIA